MIFCDIDQWRLSRSALFHYVRAARIETASGRRIDRRRHIAGEMNAFAQGISLGETGGEARRQAMDHGDLQGQAPVGDLEGKGCGLLEKDRRPRGQVADAAEVAGLDCL